MHMGYQTQLMLHRTFGPGILEKMTKGDLQIHMSSNLSSQNIKPSNLIQIPCCIFRCIIPTLCLLKQIRFSSTEAKMKNIHFHKKLLLHFAKRSACSYLFVHAVQWLICSIIKKMEIEFLWGAFVTKSSHPSRFFWINCIWKFHFFLLITNSVWQGRTVTERK